MFSNVLAKAHKPASRVTVLWTFLSFPCLRPSCEVAALFRDSNIHALLEPQIKGGVPPPASQWSLCADGSRPESEPRDRGRGWGGAPSTKTPVTQRSPQIMMLKEAPGGGCSPSRCGKMQMGEKALIPVVSEGRDHGGPCPSGRLHLYPCPGWEWKLLGAMGGGRGWGGGVTSWAQSQKK